MSLHHTYKLLLKQFFGSYFSLEVRVGTVSVEGDSGPCGGLCNIQLGKLLENLDCFNKYQVWMSVVLYCCTNFDL